MNRILMTLGAAVSLSLVSYAQDWAGIPVPANPGNGMAWELEPNASDDFNYNFNATNQRSNFGGNKWYNFYHNAWDGPGTTYWKYNHVSVDGDDLVLRASRWDRSNEELPVSQFANKMGRPQDGVNAGCITSNTRVLYPVFVEALVSVADIVLASDVWLLSPDDTQEIDIIECYGGNEQGNAFFSEFIHLSHHSFIRQPFTDYQPRDFNSWWGTPEVDNWGEYHWNNGDRRYVRIGVNWISPFHFEYYIDGEVVRVLYDKAVATNRNGTWTYAYPTMTNGVLDSAPSGFQQMTEFATGSTYSLATLQAASNASSVSIIDPYNFQGGNGFTKELDIIVNVESQDWHVAADRTPTDAQLQDPNRNTMKVDWIRTYKPVPSSTTIAVTGININENAISIQEGTNNTITANVIPSNANEQGVTWSTSNSNIATVNNGLISAVNAGTATITATSIDGSFTDAITVTVTATPNIPDNNTGDIITIEAEDFSNTSGTFNDAFAGGPGLGFNENSTIVNYVNAGDYADYAVNIPSSGDYEISYLITTPSSNAQIQLAIGNNILDTTNIPNNGSWSSYSAVSGSDVIRLNAGEATIRVTASGSNTWQWNLDKITLTKVSITTPDDETSTPEEIIIEAENFETSSGTFNDAFAGGPGLGANATATAINYVNSGDYALYSIDVAATGNYDLSYVITTPSDNAQIQMLVDGNLVDTTNIPNNGSWSNYTTISAGSVALTAGSQTVRINASGSNTWQWNLDKIILSPAGASKSISNVSNEESITLYPNPVASEAFIKGLSINKPYNYTIYDVNGALVQTGILSSTDNILDVSQFTAGIYFLNITSEEIQQMIKLIVTN